MREVGVHLHDQLGAAGERTAKPGHVGGPEPLLRRPVEDLDVAVLGGEPVGEPPVPSGELSSTISNRRPAGSWSRIAATIGSRFSASS